MITIQHQEKQFVFHVRFSTESIHSLVTAIARLIDLSDVRAFQKQKEQLPRDFGNDFLKMN